MGFGGPWDRSRNQQRKFLDSSLMFNFTPRPFDGLSPTGTGGQALRRALPYGDRRAGPSTSSPLRGQAGRPFDGLSPTGTGGQALRHLDMPRHTSTYLDKLGNHSATARCRQALPYGDRRAGPSTPRHASTYLDKLSPRSVGLILPHGFVDQLGILGPHAF